MATALLFEFPGHGHVIPSLPVIAELVRRGDRVIYYVTEPFQTAVEQTGATFRGYGAEFPLAAPQTLARFASGTRAAIDVQIESSEWVLDHLLPEIQTINPDYVLYDSLCAWGWYVGQVLAKPTVALFPRLVYTHPLARAEPLRRRLTSLARQIAQTPVRRRVARLSRRYHVPAPVAPARLMQSRGALNLVFTSRAFQPDAAALDPAHFKFVGPAVMPRPDAPAFPFDRLDGRPLILVSLGTAYNNQPAFYKMCMEALGGTPWQIVIVTGTHAAFSPQDIPENVMVCPVVPQLELLKRTTVFITHGGMNSVNEALYYDVPLVMVPQGADHAWVVDTVRALGAGIRLDKQTVTAPQLRQAVETILRDPAYLDAAKRIGATLRATGGPQQAADEIFALCTFAKL